MALYIPGITIVDADGKSKRVNWHVPPGTLTLAQMNAHMVTMAEAIDAVVDGKVTEASYIVGVELGAATIKATPTAGASVALGMNISFDATGTDYRHTVFFPSWKIGARNGLNIDTDEAVVTTLTTAFVDGTDSAGATVQPSDPYGNDLVTVLGSAFRPRKY